MLKSRFRPKNLTLAPVKSGGSLAPFFRAEDSIHLAKGMASQSGTLNQPGLGTLKPLATFSIKCFLETYSPSVIHGLAPASQIFNLFLAQVLNQFWQNGAIPGTINKAWAQNDHGHALFVVIFQGQAVCFGL